MQTGKATIKDVFDGLRIFNVPIYQRAYSWEVEDNLTDFFSDIQNQHEERQYFLGTFLFHLREKEGDFSLVDVVDGQQRLTTFLIFMDTLIEALTLQHSEVVSKRTRRIFIQDDDVFKFQTANEDSAFLHDYIFSKANSKPQVKTRSQGLLLEAKSFFEQKLSVLSIDELEKMYKTSVSSEVLLYVVPKIDQATQIFELLNDRGRALTSLESLKSFLMYNAGLISKNPDQIIRGIQDNFANIYRNVEAYDMPDGDVLRYHTIAFEKCPPDMLEKPKSLLKVRITELVNNPEKKDEALSLIRDVATRLKDTFDLFAEIQKQKVNHRQLGRIFMVGRVAPFYPLMLKALSEGEERFNLLLDRILQFTFLASLVGLRSNGESYLYTSIRNDEDYLEKLNSFYIDNWWNIKQRAADTVESENYYEWIGTNAVRYILVSYENSLTSQKGYPEIDFGRYFTNINREKLSIEHISAQRAKGVEYDDDFRERYLHSIGNLVIDYAASNSSKGNKNTADKLQDFARAPIMSQNEIDAAKDVDWADLGSIKQFILGREIRLKQFIRDNFSIPLTGC
jgi:hypothetical protein